MADIIIEGLTRRYAGVAAVEKLDLRIPHGSLLSLLGPSGCGKTTTLRMIAGFVQPTAGRIEIGGSDLASVPAHRRDLGLVFQSYALFPHMTAAENVAFGLQMRKLPRAVIAERTDRALSMVRLDGLGDRFPRQLSGGQQQRVALARALVIEPQALLLDEPLSNLDANLREEVKAEIRDVQRQLGVTTLFVTHDQQEALSISDLVGVMRSGRLEQLGPATEIYANPRTRFVATFLGGANVIDTQGLEKLAPAAIAKTVASRGSIAIRQEKVRLRPGLDIEFDAEIASASYLGATWEITLNTPVGHMRARTSEGPPRGQHVRAGWMVEDCIGLDD